MAALDLGSYGEARARLKDVLDAAASGRPVVVHRDRETAAVVDAERLRSALQRICPHAQVVGEAGGWSVFLPGVPVAADGSNLEEAVEEMVSALREYAEDWEDHLRHAPNHRENWALVQLVGLSDDRQLAGWLLGERR